MSSQSKVLVVDDERAIADLYATWLATDYTVEIAYNGSSALEVLDETVSVVILDRRMPNTSGDEVLDEIRARGFDCHVAMITAVDPDYDILEMGFDTYLKKPVKEEDIKAVVENLLRRSRYAESLTALFRKLSKREALKAQKPVAELKRQSQYQQLIDEIAELRAQSDRHLHQLDNEDFEAMFHQLSAV
ncbi:response regulator [Halogeometricum borinquense]|uniref:response regulator n=1 Tax=Halogeometricum borinquense TaxID=60847 RepID=UPI000678075E|nr:response regulator [Halogeometricum borinquense]